MKLYGKCEIPLCGHRALFVRKRKYWTKETGWIESKAETCGRCHRRVKRVLQS